MKKTSLKRAIPSIAFASVLLLILSEPALAQGGLDKVNTFMGNVLTMLRGVSITVVTIAVIWAGYKFLFKHADLSECAKILGGGLLIGTASEIAKYLLS